MKGLFKYHSECRQQPDGEFICFVVEDEQRFELAPTFKNVWTAAEIAEKMTRADEYCDKIPACPVGTPIPRPADQVFIPSATQTSPTQRRAGRRT